MTNETLKLAERALTELVAQNDACLFAAQVNAPAMTNARAAIRALRTAIDAEQAKGREAVALPPFGERTPSVMTYKDQPGNVGAWRLGEACCKAAAAPAGDPIDRGLVLLRELQAQGYGVVHLSTPHSQSAREWQPIETAPKNRIVLVHYKNSLGNGRTMRASYYQPETLESDTTESGWADEGWYEESEAYEYLMPLEHEPTHWIPLPDAPEKSAGQPVVKEN